MDRDTQRALNAVIKDMKMINSRATANSYAILELVKILETELPEHGLRDKVATSLKAMSSVMPLPVDASQARDVLRDMASHLGQG